MGIPAVRTPGGARLRLSANDAEIFCRSGPSDGLNRQLREAPSLNPRSSASESAVHRPEARTAAVAHGGDEAAVAVHVGAERPGAHPFPGAPELDRPQKPGIEDAAGI